MNASISTENQFDKIIDQCQTVFLSKMRDYGLSWRILRPSSLTDQIFIKASRIRSLEEKKISKILEGVEPEYIGIINYSVMSIIQLQWSKTTDTDLIIIHYNEEIEKAKNLMLDKNHDYDEVWRIMRVSSLTDIILQKLLRIKQIEDHDGKTDVSEGLVANYQDIINYSIFALIRLTE
jgi:hypothetical protein